MSNLSKVSHLHGTTFTTKSGLVARIKTLGPGGLKVTFDGPYTKEDTKEVDSYILSKLDPNTNATSKYYGKYDDEAKKKEQEDYLKFLKED